MKTKASLVAVIFAVMGLMLLPGPSGFCYDEFKYISKTEMTRRVLTEINSYGPTNRLITHNGQRLSVVELPYEDISKKIDGYTDCCTTTKIILGLNTKGEGRFGLFEWLFLDYSYYVSGRAKTVLRLPDGSIIEKSGPIGDSNRVVSSCGRLKD